MVTSSASEATIAVDEIPEVVAPPSIPSSSSFFDGWKERIFYPTLLGGIVGGTVGAVSKHRKVHGLANISATYATNFAIVAGCYCGAREFVRVTRKSEPDDLVNSALGGFCSGALLGRLQAQEMYNAVVDEEDLDEYYLQLLDEIVPNLNSHISSESESAAQYQNRKIKPEMKQEKRRRAVDELLIMEENGVLPYGALKKTADKYGVTRHTIERLWKRACNQRVTGDVIDVRSRKKGTVGRKSMEYSEEFLQSVPLNLRTSVRCFAGALKVSPSTIYRLLKKGKLRSHTSSNHPSLTETHKLERMKWVLSHILPGTPTIQAEFIHMENIIHIDEKWFYLNPDTRRFYLLPREDDPYRCCQSKRFKIKAMFMGVVSKPMYDAQGNLIHDGKFGIFPFVERVAAKYTTKNRDKGTIETKAVERITQKVIRDMIIQNVLPSIMSKWPAGMSKDICIQQDNARPHIQGNDEAFKAAATQNGFNIMLIQQPPQSPDLNVLDLGFFRAIQALMYQTFPKNIDELITNVQDAYDRFDPSVMKYTWLQLQWIMVEILQVRGGNNYKNPHHGKARLERLGLLPKTVKCDQVIVDEAVHYLNEKLPNESEQVEYFDSEGVIDED